MHILAIVVGTIRILQIKGTRIVGEGSEMLNEWKEERTCVLLKTWREIQTDMPACERAPASKR